MLLLVFIFMQYDLRCTYSLIAFLVSWSVSNKLTCLCSERVVIPATKPYITLQGAGMNLTFVQWHLKASDIGPDGQALTSYNTASVSVFASHFIAQDITFMV